MRLSTLHPRYLDPQGLVALWREALLTQAVLRGRTRGYRHHPQLERFRAHASPRSAINAYLAEVHAEATRRGYDFDRSKTGRACEVGQIRVTTGQVAHEWRHLMRKLSRRSPALRRRWRRITVPECHLSFMRVPGPIESWERR